MVDFVLRTNTCSYQYEHFSQFLKWPMHLFFALYGYIYIICSQHLLDRIIMFIIRYNIAHTLYMNRVVNTDTILLL